MCVQALVYRSLVTRFPLDTAGDGGAGRAYKLPLLCWWGGGLARGDLDSTLGAVLDGENVCNLGKQMRLFGGQGYATVIFRIKSLFILNQTRLSA